MARWVAPLPERVGDGEAIGKARRDLARNKTPPRGLTHAHTIADVAAEQKFGDLSGLVTLHPSYILRLTEPDAAARAYNELVSDLKLANRWLNGQSPAEALQLSQAS